MCVENFPEIVFRVFDVNFTFIIIFFAGVGLGHWADNVSANSTAADWQLQGFVPVILPTTAFAAFFIQNAAVIH
jgi:TRAP-type C4-dicarboxylate transport system permease small subunit